MYPWMKLESMRLQIYPITNASFHCPRFLASLTCVSLCFTLCRLRRFFRYSLDRFPNSTSLHLARYQARLRKSTFFQYGNGNGFIYRTYPIQNMFMTVLQLFVWGAVGLQPVKGASGSCYQFIFDLTQPPNRGINAKER